MKTILQIAKDLGVSKQAVYKRFKGKLHTAVSPYVHTKDGTTYISEQGIEIIKQDFLKSSTYIGAHTEYTQEPLPEHIQDIAKDTATDTGIHTLIQMLQRELEIKNRQIEELMATIRIQAESINAIHKNELAETIIDGQPKLEQPRLEAEKKRGLFRWIRRQ